MDDARDETIDWTHSRPRRIAPEDRKRFEAYLREIFSALGMPVQTPGTEITPERFLRAMFEATDGYEGDPKLITAFPTECKGGPDCKVSQVIEGPIPFYSLCEHHALPFFGYAYVGYVAHDNIVGISKLTRIVRLFARRFSVQERIGREIADLIERILKPHGVAVYLSATHLCTQMRGVQEHESQTGTTHWRGNYEADAGLRAEFLGIPQIPRRA
jgi:GTP cyclohydrolase I